jgi:hypothetical protein
MARRRKVRNSLKIISTSWIDGKVGIYGEVVKEGECPFFKREGFSQEPEGYSSANWVRSRDS